MPWLLKKLKERWSVVRIIRLLLSVFVGIQGAIQSSSLLIAFAFILLIQSLRNYRCVPCADEGTCGSVPLNATNKLIAKSSFEEIK
jgi:hypothetical protein